MQGVAVIIANNSTMKLQRKAKFEGNQGRGSGTIALYNSSQLIVGKKSNVTFLSNNAQPHDGAISADSSTIAVESKAKMAFTENKAYSGGALALKNGAGIALKSYSQVAFTGNHAQQYGGALYVEEPIQK